MDPQSLQDWAKNNEPNDKLRFKNGFWPRVIFVRDIISYILFKDHEHQVTVISTHTSKSVRLPVYQIQLPNGLIFTMRYNFHNWKISVDSPKEILF